MSDYGVADAPYLDAAIGGKLSSVGPSPTLRLPRRMGHARFSTVARKRRMARRVGASARHTQSDRGILASSTSEEVAWPTHGQAARNQRASDISLILQCEPNSYRVMQPEGMIDVDVEL